MTPEQAEQAGRAAYARPGAVRAPATDAAVMGAVVGMAVGDVRAADLFRAWLRGWDAAADDAAAAVLDAEPDADHTPLRVLALAVACPTCLMPPHARCEPHAEVGTHLSRMALHERAAQP